MKNSGSNKSSTSSEFIIKEKSYKYPLLTNVHLKLELLPEASTPPLYTRGDFAYFHYCCDGFSDNGWGCAYCTLQSICSWILNKKGTSKAPIPSIYEIQQTLVNLGDKPPGFIGSKDWIGALEVFYVIDKLYDVTCKILHVRQGEDIKKYADELQKYFEDFGGLVMMGGDVDAASKGIAGMQIIGNKMYLLVVDPHYAGVPKSVDDLIHNGYIRWQHTSDLVDSSFYNICLPLFK